jgi:aspartate kinase
MPILVQKYGGSSVADEAKIASVARRVVKAKEEGYQVVVVVSAMGKTTDELLGLAHSVHPDPPRRELDMLVSVGERISMTLLSMAIHRLGHDAISFTGSQCGIITNDRHLDARIIEIRPFRLQDELERGRIVIVAGYQGMSFKREITTLGRGGSDTTAVALAAALDAECCEILGDVDGVYSADPSVIDDAKHLAELNYAEMQELAESGAKVLNATAVEFAKERGIALYVRRSDGQGAHTLIRKSAPRLPGAVIGIAHEESVRVFATEGEDRSLDDKVLAFLDEQEIPGKQLSIHRFGSGDGIAVVVSQEFVPDANSCTSLLDDCFGEVVQLRSDLGAVSLIGTGINQTFQNLRRCLTVLRGAGIEPSGVHTSSFRITALVDSGQVQDAVRLLHREFIEETVPTTNGDV